MKINIILIQITIITNELYNYYHLKKRDNSIDLKNENIIDISDSVLKYKINQIICKESNTSVSLLNRNNSNNNFLMGNNENIKIFGNTSRLLLYKIFLISIVLY